jgi:hypothetical protein
MKARYPDKAEKRTDIQLPVADAGRTGKRRHPERRRTVRRCRRGQQCHAAPDVLSVVNDITQALRFVGGYDLINGLDGLIIGGWNDLANDLDLGSSIGPDALLAGPLIPGQPLIGLVGGGFDIFNFFGA